MAYLQPITMVVICAGSATHYARTPFPAALVSRGNFPKTGRVDIQVLPANVRFRG
jgi:hypothetical protein